MKCAAVYLPIAIYLLLQVFIVNSDSSRKVLQLVAMVSVPTESSHIAQDWERGLEILPGARVAVEEVNRNTDILPGYQLELVELITEGCSRDLALVQLIQHLHYDVDNSTVGVVGPLCNEATELIATIASHPEFSLVQIAAAPSLIVMDRNAFPYLFQMLPLSNAYIDTAFELMRLFGWNKVAVLCSLLEQDEYDCRTAEAFEKKAIKEGVEIVFYDTIVSGAVSSVLNYLWESGANIIFAFVLPSTANKLICTAYELGLKWPDYAWILPGINGEKLSVCAADNVTTAVTTEGAITLEIDNTPLYDTVQGASRESDDKAFYSAYIKELNSTQQDFKLNAYAPVFYNSVRAFALALNKSFPNHTIGPKTPHRSKSYVARKITDDISSLSFQGVFGDVEFDSDQKQIHIAVQAKQIRGGNSTCISRYNPVNRTITIIDASLFGDFPDDELDEVYKLRLFPLDLFMAIVVSFCIVFTTVMFLLYVRYHGEPEIKATSTTITLFMFLGCYLQLFSVLTNIVIRNAYIAHSATERAFLCNVDVWMGALGLILVLATLFARTLRVYRVFTYFGKTGWLCSDGALCALILCFVLVDVFLLALWTSVDAYHLVDAATYNQKGTPPSYELVQVCKCEYLGLWGGLLFGYSSFILIALLIVAVKTRKIRRENFKDTKKVNILLVSYVVTRAITLSIWVIFKNSSPTVSTSAVLVAFILTALFCQVFLFLPKTFPPFWRQVRKKLPKGSSSSGGTKSITFSFVALTLNLLMAEKRVERVSPV